MSKEGKMDRIDEEFSKELKEVMKVRVQKGFADPFKNHGEEISIREATNLLKRTNGWKTVLEELKTKPKKKENEFDKI